MKNRAMRQARRRAAVRWRQERQRHRKHLICYRIRQAARNIWPGSLGDWVYHDFSANLFEHPGVFTRRSQPPGAPENVWSSTFKCDIERQGLHVSKERRSYDWEDAFNRDRSRLAEALKFNANLLWKGNHDHEEMP